MSITSLNRHNPRVGTPRPYTSRYCRSGYVIPAWDGAPQRPTSELRRLAEAAPPKVCTYTQKKRDTHKVKKKNNTNAACAD